MLAEKIFTNIVSIITISCILNISHPKYQKYICTETEWYMIFRQCRNSQYKDGTVSYLYNGNCHNLIDVIRGQTNYNAKNLLKAYITHFEYFENITLFRELKDCAMLYIYYSYMIHAMSYFSVMLKYIA